MDVKFCSICNTNILKKNYSRHLRSPKHLKNLENTQEPHVPVEISIPTEQTIQSSIPTESTIQPSISLKIKKTNKRNFINYNFENDDYIISESEEALEGCFLTLRIQLKKDINNVEILIVELPNILFDIFNSLLKERKGLKVQSYLNGLFYNGHLDVIKEIGIISKNKIILNSEEINTVITNLIKEIKDKIDEWDNNEAYWNLNKILFIDFKLREYNPLRGSSYIPTPRDIYLTKSVINIKNEDNKCFKYCILYGLFKNEISDNPERIYHYRKIENKYPNRLNFEGIEFPVKIESIEKFCNQNKDISINVYYIGEKNKIFPYKTCTQEERKTNHMNLLLLQDNDKSHYVIINNLSRLISSQLSKNKNKKFICDRCLHFTSDEELINKHYEFCDYYQKYEKAIPILPEKSENILKFKNLKNCVSVPLVYYSDFESVIKKTIEGTSKHELCSYSFYGLGQNEFYKNFQIYTGKTANDTINHYINTLKDEAIKLDKELKNRLEEFKKHNLSDKDEERFNNETKCHFCKLKFTTDDIKVRDHCHITGKFRGAAHQLCNLRIRTSLDTKIIFHNGTNYDFKMIVKKLYKVSKEINAIPFTDEKFLTFSIKIPDTKIKFTFIDSYRFLGASLDNLANNFNIESFKHTLNHLNNKYPHLDINDLNLIIRKGVFPYEYLDSFDKLNDTKLPNKISFYSTIKGKHISQEDYNRAEKVFKLLGCNNLKDYLEVYLSIDVFLLTDIFEHFRKVAKNYYDLDPAHYYSAPGLSWDAMLKMTKVELELLTDPDMLYFFMEGITGGLSFINKRYVKANNKYMSTFDKNKESSFIIPLDAVNLYGCGMSQSLPKSNFNWCTDEEIKVIEQTLMDIPDDNSTGFTCQVDLEYTKDLYDYHNDFPFFPEHKIIDSSMLSNYQQKLVNKDLGNINKTPKLIASLEDKNKIVVDYRNLKQALKNGLKIKKIHKILTYKQEPWLKNYIDINTSLRKKAKNTFEQNFFKLMNNSVYGKTIENITKRQDIKFLVERKKALKYISKINFKKETIFSKHLVAVHMNKEKIIFNKPIYAGFCVLQLSKHIMYEFVYDYIKPKWNNSVEICGGDTDSLFLHIKTQDFYEDIKPDINRWFDTSNFEENNKFNIRKVNEKVLGKFKIDLKSGDNIVEEFVGLRAKTYNMKIEGEENKIAQKGVPRHKIINDIDTYKEILFNETKNYVDFNRIGSKKLNIYTLQEKKVALSNFDDKRYILDDGISTLAYGHFRIKENDN